MSAPMGKVTLVLTARQARALQEHLKAVPTSFTGHSPLEEAVVLLSDAVVRAIKKEAKGKDGAA